MGTEAFDLAARIYRAVDAAAWAAVEAATDLSVADGDERLNRRFAGRGDHRSPGD